MNSCTFIGNIGKKPETRQAGENKVCNFSIACNKKIKGENQTTWIPMVAWGKVAEIIETYLDKGSKIAVRAEYQTRTYEKDGKTVYAHDFRVLDFEMLDNKHKDNNNGLGYADNGEPIPF